MKSWRNMEWGFGDNEAESVSKQRMIVIVTKLLAYTIVYYITNSP